MAFAHVGRAALSLGVVGSVIVAVASCAYEDRGYYRDCDYVDTRCQQVCDYYCDYYSCYPTCWDQCWDECGQTRRRPSSSSSGAVPVDASVPIPVSDGGSPVPPVDAGSSGTGVLCTSCTSNVDCESGALCILRGGPPRDAGVDAGGPLGRGFCGAKCSTSQDCPDGFLCSQLGSSRQCLPTGDACE